MDENSRSQDTASLIAMLLKSAIENNLIRDLNDVPRHANAIRQSLEGGSGGRGQTAIANEALPQPAVLEVPIQESYEPVVPVEESVNPDFLVCLECGGRFKSIKRHLNTSHGLTPNTYARRYNLPHDYPMVAPKYGEARSRMAKELGLGRKPGAKASANADSDAKPAAKRGGKKVAEAAE